MQSTANLRVGWDAEPPGQVSLRFGTDWVRSGRSALLVVPSVIVPEERNVLINPVHADETVQNLGVLRSARTWNQGSE